MVMIAYVSILIYFYLIFLFYKTILLNSHVKYPNGKDKIYKPNWIG